MTLEQAAKVKNTEIAKELVCSASSPLPPALSVHPLTTPQCLPPVKLHCSMLAEDAIKSAITNYYKKNPDVKATNLAGREAKLEAATA